VHEASEAHDTLIRVECKARLEAAARRVVGGSHRAA
jgi:hypothetical protein